MGGKRQSPRSFLPGIEFETTNAMNRKSGSFDRIFPNIRIVAKAKVETEEKKKKVQIRCNGQINEPIDPYECSTTSVD